MKGFSDDERERIRADLIESGRALFIQFGLERTRIKDITEEVDIGTSTFYRFFDSKEHLYTEVLYREIDRFTTELEGKITAESDPREQVRVALTQSFEEVESNPIIKNLIIEDEVRTLQTQLSEEKRREVSAEFENVFVATDEWVELETFKYDDPTVVNEFFRTLAFSTRYKDVHSRETSPGYPEIRDELIDTIVDGLFDDSG
ncbi:TetR/AcrR family transcriptional regulator [Natronolimnobius sp. AArcel1]|uniref:TetR/AcrR family transcriptional regulator n=1 Tax=Natronolimnobius sp. AArcel1 TaxID=1679093 RepID=UPI0013EA7D5C|nr:TetR/AcrR family transcriptional regulator [Natronolimnobius sp. AArcel1]NGM67817.1 TetR/AcrR family transcriptional regulator [Natronolimnobius sp. AArcel1]